MPYALITGGSKGIGLAIARQLADRGYDLLLVARSEDKLKQAAAFFSPRVKCNWLALDLAKPGAAETVYNWCIEKNYPVQVLVNNAGYGLSGPFENYDVAATSEMLNLNIITLVQITRLFLPELRKHSTAFVLNIASSAAYQAVPFLSAYSASKAFVLMFSRGLKNELQDSPVSVTCICPGPTDTDFVHRAGVPAKGQQMAEKFNMTADAVAILAVNAMLKRKTEVITGGMNKLSAALSWLMPKPLVENIAKKIYQ